MIAGKTSTTAGPTRVAWRRGEAQDELATREWLVANGLGGYACGTLGGLLTRRFHGMLVASLGHHRGRTMIMNSLAAELLAPDGRLVSLDGSDSVAHGKRWPEALVEVRLERGLPVWRYEVAGAVLQRTVMLPHERNTTLVTWRLLASPGPVRLRVSPAFHVRPHEGNLAADPGVAYPVTAGPAEHP